jgi:hypothetical protein
MNSLYIQPVDQFYDDQTVTSFISDMDSGDFDTSTNLSLDLEDTNVKVSEHINMNNINRKVEILKFRSIQMLGIISVNIGNCVGYGINKAFSQKRLLN